MRRRNILDAFAGAMCVYAMMITTPAGELVVRTYHWAVGGKPAARTLLSYFNSDGAAAAPDPALAQAIAQAPLQDSATTLVAKRVGLPPNLARAVAVMASSGKTVDGHFDV